MADAQPNPNGLQISGGAAIMAPVSAFPNGVPGNAIIVIPMAKPSDELKEKLERRARSRSPSSRCGSSSASTARPCRCRTSRGGRSRSASKTCSPASTSTGNESQDDLQRGRIYAQELMKYGRLQRAEQVLSKLVAKGGTGDDWLALGVTQLQQKKLDKAEGTLKGAQNLLKQNPYPSLHLAKLYARRKRRRRSGR
jgi:predicted Zn-dependent protease